MNDEPPLMQDQLQALERFVIANRDLEELESVAKRFNIFEARSRQQFLENDLPCIKQAFLARDWPAA